MLSVHPRIPLLPFSLFKILHYLSRTNSNAASSLRPFHIFPQLNIFLFSFILCFHVFFLVMFSLHILFCCALYIITCISISHTRLKVFWQYEPHRRKLCIVPSMNTYKVFGWILCVDAWKIRTVQLFLPQMEKASFSFFFIYSLSQVEWNLLFLTLLIRGVI